MVIAKHAIFTLTVQYVLDALALDMLVVVLAGQQGNRIEKRTSRPEGWSEQRKGVSLLVEQLQRCQTLIAP